jgi:hypothetical protein
MIMLKRTLYIGIMLSALSAAAYAATAAHPAGAIVSGDSPGDSVFYFYFPFNSDRLMIDYHTNKSRFAAVGALLKTERFTARIDSIRITGGACLIGTTEVNRKLSQKRAAALGDWLRWMYPDLSAPIHSDMVEREEAKRLYHICTDSLRLPGAVANRHLRYAGLRFVMKEPEEVKTIVERGEVTKIEEAAVTEETGKTEEVTKIEEIEEVAVQEEIAVWEETGETAEPVRERTPLLAVKTNLLYDLALTPDIEAEIPLGKRWSISGEFQHGWWLKKDNTFCWQFEALGLEGRYWLGDRRTRRVLTGWFAGAFAGIGVYDFQLKRDRGAQGDFYISAGISGGYATQFGTSPWGMEFSLGAGYLTTDYTRYRVYQDRLVRHGAQMRFSGIVPLKAKVALVYMFYHRRKGGAR